MLELLISDFNQLICHFNQLKKEGFKT